jgi:hypothetical protein
MKSEVASKASSSFRIGGKLSVGVFGDGVALPTFGAFVSGDVAIDNTVGCGKHAEGVKGIVSSVALSKVVDAGGEESREVGI